MTKDEALTLLHSHLKNVNLRRHCYAVGAIMKALAIKLGGDLQKWEVVGLLHDGDYEETKNTPHLHTIRMVDWLKERNINDSEIVSAILSHNFAHTGQNQPQNLLEWSLYCCDELSGLIIAVALVRPEKKLSTVTLESVMKKWKQVNFAAGVNRSQIENCQEKLGLKLPEFIAIALEAMQKISSELGL